MNAHPGGLPSSVGEVVRTLEKLPPHEDVVFRGWNDTDVWGSGAGSFVTSGLTATSRDPRVASENFTTTGLYAISSRTGRAIEQFSARREEREVVLLPATVLVWGGRVTVGDVVVTLIDEVVLSEATAGGMPTAELERRVAGRVRSALERADVVVGQRGRFVGPFE